MIWLYDMSMIDDIHTMIYTPHSTHSYNNNNTTADTADTRWWLASRTKALRGKRRTACTNPLHGRRQALLVTLALPDAGCSTIHTHIYTLLYGFRTKWVTIKCNYQVDSNISTGVLMCSSHHSYTVVLSTHRHPASTTHTLSPCRFFLLRRDTSSVVTKPRHSGRDTTFSTL